jgi:hypothetical protein
VPATPRDQQILEERIRGDTLEAIGRRHGCLTREGVRFIVAREGERQVADLIRRLRENVGTGQLEVLLIPNGPDLDAALAHLRWVLTELAERGMRTIVHPRIVPNGVAFGLELADADHAQGGA